MVVFDVVEKGKASTVTEKDNEEDKVSNGLCPIS